jgi:glycosyltransferase involved in cell wall biosynthesis
MRIAVGIPVFNDSVFLERSIKNCIDVGYDNVVYYDDGSTDDTYSKLMDLTKDYDHIVVLKSKENSINTGKINRWELVSKKCQEFNPNWIMVRAADECLSYPAFKDGPNLFRRRLEQLLNTDCNMIRFKYVDLWRSTTWFRSDGYWGNRSSISCWRNDIKWYFNYAKGVIHVGSHRPNKLSVPIKPCQINDKGPRIVILHYGMSSDELLEDKFRYQIEISRTNKAHGIPKKIPYPTNWPKINGYKIGYEFNIKLEKVFQSWYKDDVKYDPEPTIKSLFPLLLEYDKNRALAYKKIYDRVF